MSHNYPYRRPPSDSDLRPEPGPYSSSDHRHASQDHSDFYRPPQESFSSPYPSSSSSSSSRGPQWSQDGALSILSSCGLEPSDLSLLAELPEDVLTVESLPHVLQQIKGKRGTVKPFASTAPSPSSSSSSSYPHSSAQRPAGDWNRPHNQPIQYPMNHLTPHNPLSSDRDRWGNPRTTDQPASSSSISSSYMVDFHHQSGPSEYGKMGPASSQDFHHRPGPSEYGKTGRDRGPVSSQDFHHRPGPSEYGKTGRDRGPVSSQDFHHRPGPSDYGKTGRDIGPGSAHDQASFSSAGRGKRTRPSRFSEAGPSDYRSAPPPEQYRPKTCEGRREPDSSSIRSSNWPSTSATSSMPSKKEALDFHGTAPPAYPYSCSLCDITVMSEKVWIKHINGSQHADGQLSLLQQFPNWDCRMETVSRSDNQSEKWKDEGKPSQQPQAANQNSKPQPNKKSEKKASERSKVVCVKFPPQSVDEAYLRKLAEPFGKIVKILMFPSLAFVELGSIDQAKDLVKFHVNYPPTVNGEQMEFRISNTFNFLQSSRVVSFTPAPTGENGQSDLISIIKRFGAPLYTLFLPSTAFVEMKNAPDAQKLVDYYSSNTLRIDSDVIAVSFSGEYNSLMRVPSAKRYEEETTTSVRSLSRDKDDKTTESRRRRSRTRTRSRSRDRSTKEKRTRTRSRSRDRSTKEKRTRSRSRDKSTKEKRTRTRSRSREESRDKSSREKRSRSESKEKSTKEKRTRTRSRSREESRDKSGREKRSRSKSKEKSNNEITDSTRSRSGSRDKSREKSSTDRRIRSRSKSREKSVVPEKTENNDASESRTDPDPEPAPVSDSKPEAEENKQPEEEKEEEEEEEEEDESSAEESDIEGMEVIGEDGENLEDEDMEALDDADEEEEEENETGEAAERTDSPEADKEEEVKDEEAGGQELQQEEEEEKPVNEKEEEKEKPVKEEQQEEDEEERDFPVDLENCITLDELGEEDQCDAGDEEAADGSRSPSTRVVHFRNLPQRSYTDAEFIRLVKDFGTAVRFFHKPPSCGFIEMSSSSEALRAVRELSSQPVTFNGSRLDVQISNEYERLTNGCEVQEEEEDKSERRTRSSSRRSERLNEDESKRKSSKKTPEKESTSKQKKESKTGKKSSEKEPEAGSPPEKTSPGKESVGKTEAEMTPDESTNRKTKKTPEKESGSKKTSRTTPENESVSVNPPKHQVSEEKTPLAAGKESDQTEETEDSAERTSAADKTPEKETSSKTGQENESLERKETHENDSVPEKKTRKKKETQTEREAPGDKMEVNETGASEEETSGPGLKDSDQKPQSEEKPADRLQDSEVQEEQRSEPAGGAEELQRPTKPVGTEFVRPVVGYFCNLCQVIYADEDEAKLQHCSTAEHYRKYQEKTGKDPWTS